MPTTNPKSNSKPTPSRRQNLLSSSRPPLTFRNPLINPSTLKPSFSSKTTRALIRSHHTLQKRLAQAIAANDTDLVEKLESEAKANGGLELYQIASTIGQGRERGGDSSHVLVGWLREVGVLVCARQGGLGSKLPVEKNDGMTGGGDDGEDAVMKEDGMHAVSAPGKSRELYLRPLRVLEVGALSPYNAITTAYTSNPLDTSSSSSPSKPTKPKITQVRHIDLHSQHPLIEQQDFMTLDPNIPWRGETGYDVISLSLVVNYVGDARERGRMLRHTASFLRRQGKGAADDDTSTATATATATTQRNSEPGSDGMKSTKEQLLPSLFLVLPLPCIDNSRYLTEQHLISIMSHLGYEMVRTKRSGKLYSSLWRLHPNDDIHISDTTTGKRGSTTSSKDSVRGRARHSNANEHESKWIFKKQELRKGKDRNNFCIILDEEGD